MRILTIADLHIGAIKDTAYVYNVVTDIFEKELIFNKTDAVIFLGDYFHKLCKVNEESTSLAINIMSYLVRLCKKNNTKIRCVYGTESHEMSQYNLFNHHLTDQELDIKIIETVTREELFNNLYVLYIPEEYVESKEEYYKEFLDPSNSYDYIFGHGIISEGMPMMVYDKGAKSNEKKVPHFKSAELSQICGMCVFGHYHVHTKIEDGVYYLGSLFRDSFGEESPKGYGIVEHGNFSFIENTAAHMYDTIIFDGDSIVYQDNVELTKAILDIKERLRCISVDGKQGRIRLVFKVPQSVDPSFKETLRTLLFNDKYITPLIKETSELITEIQQEIDTEYDFILDNSLSITDKIHRYINKQYEHEISLDELMKYIHEEFNI